LWCKNQINNIIHHNLLNEVQDDCGDDAGERFEANPHKYLGDYRHISIPMGQRDGVNAPGIISIDV